MSRLATIANAPWPGAGMKSSIGNRSEILSAIPSFASPASASMIASNSPLSILSNLNSTFPKRGSGFTSGLARLSWATLIGLLVPTLLPTVKSFNSLSPLLTRTSAGEPLSGTLAITSRVFLSVAGTSFMLWTAKSTLPSMTAWSTSLSNIPLCWRENRDLPLPVSLEGSMIFLSIFRPAFFCRIRSTTRSV